MSLLIKCLDPCCEPPVICTILFDPFGDENSTDVGNGWVEDSGDWIVDQGYLTVSGAVSNAFIRQTVDEFPASGKGIIEATLEGIGTGGFGDVTANVVGAYSDADNYIMGRILMTTAGAAVIRIVERAGGIETTIAGPTSIGDYGINLGFSTLRLCWNGTASSLYHYQTQTFIEGDTALLGTQGAIKATVGSARTLRVQEVELKKHNEDESICETCEQPGEPPEDPEGGYCCDDVYLPGGTTEPPATVHALIYILNGTGACPSRVVVDDDLNYVGAVDGGGNRVGPMDYFLDDGFLTVHLYCELDYATGKYKVIMFTSPEIAGNIYCSVVMDLAAHLDCTPLHFSKTISVHTQSTCGLALCGLVAAGTLKVRFEITE